MKILIVSLTALPLAVTLFTAGCATEPLVTKSIKDRMAAQPDKYRRVEVLPIWFDGSAAIDASLTTNDLKTLNRQARTNLVTALAQVLADKGYEVLQTSPVLCGDEDLEAFDPDARRMLSAARTNFMNLSLEICANRPNQRDNPYDCKTEPCVAELRKKLGQSEADLVVMMESAAFFESAGARSKRKKWNWIGGTLLTPLAVAAAMGGAGGVGLPLESSPGWTAHAVLIADARTLEVLYWNGRKFRGEDARKPEVLSARLRDTLADLPELRRGK